MDQFDQKMDEIIEMDKVRQLDPLDRLQSEDSEPVISSTLDDGFEIDYGHFKGRGGCRGRGRRGWKKWGRGRGHRGPRGHRGFHGKRHGKHGHHGPNQEEIVEFLSDDVAVSLLSDVLVQTFEAVKQSNFEIALPDTLQAIVLSDDKYKVLTEHKVWPHFVNV